MALKNVRVENFVNPDYFMNETGEAGSVVVFDTTSTGLGEGLDDSANKVILPNATNGSGEIPAGILVGDVVALELDKQHLNPYKRESQIGNKVGIIRDGQVTTNRIASGTTPSTGEDVYFTAEGLLSSTSTNSTKVGTWLSGLDSDGYAKLEVKIG